MAYIVKYDDDYLFDPYTNDDTIYDAKISANVNAAAYFDFTIPSEHRLYNSIEEQAGIVRVYSDKKLLFMGEITEIDDDFEGNKSVSCADPRIHLNDILLRPYSTVKDEEENLAPSSIDGYFQWLIDQYNNRTLNSKFRFQVGVNQGSALTKNNYIYIKNENLPGIGSELENQILDSYGGYLTMTYPEDIPTLNLYADVHEANTQIIDFGVNLIDFKRSSSTDDQYTAIRPVGGTPERTDDDPEGYVPKPITIEDLPDGTTQIDADYVKLKDVVYSVSRVNRYGYKEYNWTNSSILDRNTLLQEAVSDLKKCVDPSKTLEVKAVDLALFANEYDHLECGEVARIRSKPHNIDEYLLVNSMEINLQDPSQTTYTLGEAYNSLTGEQSSFVKALNAGINSSLDKVSGLDHTVKDQAAKVEQAVSDAADAVDTANDANKLATDAQQTADTANENAIKAQQTADTANDTANSANKVATSAQQTANVANEAANSANENAIKAQQTANAANEIANSTKEEVSKIQTDIGNIDTDIENIKRNAQATSEKADAAATKADEAGEKADALQESVSKVQTTVNDVQSDVGELKTSVSGAVEKSNEALTAASSAQQNLDGFKMEVSQTYQVKGDYATNDSLNDAIEQEVLDRNSAISQSASEIKQTVSETYQVKGDYLTEGKAAETYATQSSVSQTANSIKTEVSKTYATIATVDGLKNIADNAIESWTGSTAPTTSNKPASDWTTSELKKQHSGDLYYDTSTGYSYRYGSTDSINYSWSLVKDTDITKALANASAAKQAADTAQSGVDKINADLPVTYATKSDVTQTADSIKTEVSKTYSTKTETSAVETKAETAQTTADAAKSAASTAQSTANTAKQNAATAQSTADNVKSDLSNYKNTVSETYSTKSDLTQTADSIKTEVSKTYSTKEETSAIDSKADTAKSTADNAQKNIEDFKKTANSTYATKTELSQTSDSIKAEVSETYTTKTEADEISAAADTAQQTANNTSDRLTEMKSSLELLSDSISTMVTDENGSSLMTQTSTGWTFNIGGIQSSIENNATQINKVSGNVTEIENLAQQTNDLVNDISEKTAYITMAEDEDGDPCVELGRQDSPFKVRITNTSIDFMEDDIRIAYITNRQLYIQSSVVTDEMKVGATSGFVWKKRGNGNMGLRWEAS